ncbi:short-chain dehydrogenase/reductase family 16C member 6-like isoform X2 [Myzus persicae]|nr:short-chain dehydrogenase/reductase family 16C member 6-like isoform X2 [Myzus persicae]
MKWSSVFTELLLLLVKSVYYIGESIYHMFVPLTEKSLADDIVLITGTGHGIGKCLAMQFAEVSSKVVCVDINAQSNAETAKEINAKWKGKAFAYTCDVSTLEKVRELGEKVEREVGTVTILVNNAGIMPCKPLEAHDEATIKKIFEVNVFAHFWMLDTFLPRMKALNNGHLVFLSSMAGIIGLKNLVPYCASKFAVRGLAEALTDECRVNGFTNLHFTSIFPYMVDTGLCKKPKIRFPSLLPLVTPEATAKEIISAVRRNLFEHSIPSSLLAFNNIFRCYPHKMALDLKDFMGSGVDAHDD